LKRTRLRCNSRSQDLLLDAKQLFFRRDHQQVFGQGERPVELPPAADRYRGEGGQRRVRAEPVVDAQTGAYPTKSYK
jgi:hypothetical protein